MKSNTLYFWSLLVVLINTPVFSQNTGISDIAHTPVPSAVLDVYSTTRGMLTPRMLQTERVAIASPAKGLLVYQTDGLEGFYYYNGTAWSVIAPWQINGTSVYYNTGNVGIGISTPAALLHAKSSVAVAGGTCLARFEGIANTGASNNVNLQLINNSPSSSKTLMMMGGTAWNLWCIGNDLYGTNAQNFYIFDLNSLSTRFLIDANGNTGIGTIAPASTLQVAGSLSLPIATKAANYTATVTDHTVLCNTGSMTLTLPTAVGIGGRIYVIKKTSAVAGTITIDPNGSETIDGALTNTAIVNQYQSLTVQSDGANWFILSNN
jgi:hypothetical protein